MAEPITFNIKCWNCGKENNRVAAINSDSRPSNGCATICFTCGSLAIFDDSYPDGARKPTPSEMDELKSDEDIFRALLAWQKYNQRRER